MSSKEWKVEELTDAERLEMESTIQPSCKAPIGGPEGDEEVAEDWDPNAPQTEEDGE